MLVSIDTDDLSRVLSALHDLQNGWALCELTEGWRESASRIRASLVQFAGLGVNDFEDFNV